VYEGSCLCGSITYRVDGELSDFGYCHCRSCRKASGSAYGANAGVDRADVTLSDAGGYLREYESSPGTVRTFCSSCGSPIYAYLTTTPDVIRIRLGTLDTAFEKRARAHTFVSDKASWDVIEGELPRFDEWPPRDVLIQKGSRQPSLRTLNRTSRLAHPDDRAHSSTNAINERPTPSHLYGRLGRRLEVRPSIS
jgi:hypothetical protein